MLLHNIHSPIMTQIFQYLSRSPSNTSILLADLVRPSSSSPSEGDLMSSLGITGTDAFSFFKASLSVKSSPLCFAAFTFFHFKGHFKGLGWLA